MTTSMMMMARAYHQNAGRDARPLKVVRFLNPRLTASPKPTGPP
jgi:hypothetical protein